MSYCGWTSRNLSACAHACLQEVQSISERAGELELASLDTRAGGSGAHDDDDIQMDDPVGTRAMPPPPAPAAARCAAHYTCFCPPTPPPPFCLAGLTLSLLLMPATCCLTVRGRGRGAGRGRGRAGAAAPKAAGRQTSITEVLSQSSSRVAAAATR